MQSLAVLWFQLQIAEQSLREKYFAPTQVPAKTEPTTIGTPRRANRKNSLLFRREGPVVGMSVRLSEPSALQASSR
jgi:hypothetical protein